ncbi:MAG: type II toxin-antitoxin system RelE/ParE family toxin [Xenococcaceae cyanobacterium]
MIVSFGANGTENIFNGVDTRAARRTCPTSLWALARRKLDQLDSAVSLDDLRIPPGNKLEALRGDRKAQHSIRINDRYRICFVWTESGSSQVEIVDYH